MKYILSSEGGMEYNMDFKQQTKYFVSEIDEALKHILLKAESKFTGDLREAMEYALFPGGSRWRPLVLLGCFDACIGFSTANLGAKTIGETPMGKIAVDFAAAIEMIHAYSLIHDDLPAMDNADTRRGKPSVHKKFGEATAILAGDALLNLAYETLLSKIVESNSSNIIKAAQVIADYAGVKGMVGGQAADLHYENKDIDADVLSFILNGKTAALFNAAACAGMVLGGSRLTGSTEYWQELGVAFQIKDDILNATGDAKLLGKPVGNDADSKKNSYVAVHGLEKARFDMRIHAETGRTRLSNMFGEDAYIIQLARHMFE